VDDSPAPDGSSVAGQASGLVRGAIYTVREVVEFWGDVGIRLAEVRKSNCPVFGIELYFGLQRFRPGRRPDPKFVERLQSLPLNQPIREDA
jgi:hypothetical protein